jgi:hypothetical protein
LAVPLVGVIDENDSVVRREKIIERSREKYGLPSLATKPEPEPELAEIESRPIPPAAASAPETVSRPLGALPSKPTSPKPPRAVATSPQSDVAALGRGGPQHKYLQELVKRFGEAQGYRATIEKPTPSGGSVDVALERADGSIAVEISVTSSSNYESSNITKCLTADYARVVLLAPERKKLDAVAKRVRESLLDSERARVEFLLPEEFLTYLSTQTPPPVSEEQVAGYTVRVQYKKPTDAEGKARERALTEVIAKSRKKLND